MHHFLEHIKTSADVKAIKEQDLSALCDELRQTIVHTVQKNGGHLASNLGVIELTVALHRVFDTPTDQIVWDVGHQAYAHKLLTGRSGSFDTLRQLNGISGFPKHAESPHDAFDTGHSSTSISAALGLARARDLKGETSHVVAVIGDGALTGGMCFEALNDAGDINRNFIVILNDNDMSIAHNVGGMNKYLARIRIRPGYTRFKRKFQRLLWKIPLVGKPLANGLERLKNRIKFFLLPSVFFEEIGFAYFGPIDGHNIGDLTRMLQHAKELDRPVFLHVVTQKGKGYKPAEDDPEKFHGVAPFLVDPQSKPKTNCSSVAGKTLEKMAQQDPDVAAITAAMPLGTGLTDFAEKFPKRFFDVGIAEQHAVTMAAGLARGGLKPYFAVYSTFLQRAYDQVIHDVCMPKLPVVFCIDRAGIVGEDGETHQGIFDIAMLSQMPNMTVLSPSSMEELQQMLLFSKQIDGPCAVRYPRGTLPERTAAQLAYGRWEMMRPPKKITVLATGNMVAHAEEALQMQGAPDCGLVNVRFIKPMDIDMLAEVCKTAETIVTVEDGTVVGGMGSMIAAWCAEHACGTRVVRLGVQDIFVPQGSVRLLYEQVGLSPNALYETLRSLEESHE